jgi:sec-independent protein translocase protein TatA
MNFFGIGLPEMAVIAAIGLLVFGPKRLPELGRTLGRTLKGFQSASSEFEKEFRTAIAPQDTAAAPAAEAVLDAVPVAAAAAEAAVPAVVEAVPPAVEAAPPDAEVAASAVEASQPADSAATADTPAS